MMLYADPYGREAIVNVTKHPGLSPHRSTRQSTRAEQFGARHYVARYGLDGTGSGIRSQRSFYRSEAAIAGTTPTQDSPATHSP